MSLFPSIVPRKLVKAYQNNGITELFDWQAKCLSNEHLYEPFFENLVYTAPTSAGKTLVSEVISACNVLKTGKRTLFIYPYVSSAREKLFDLQSLWRSINLVVKAFIGASSSSLHGWSAAVCTIEKANTLINAFIEMDLLSEIGVVVVDELHMIFDGERGALVESMISKILYASVEKSLHIQIIGMSATLEEHNSLAKWMNAHIYVSNFRPLSLREFVVIDGAVFDLNEKRKDRVLAEDFLIKSDVKNLIGTTIEASLEKKAVLIFCSTKAETEKYAMALNRYIRYCIAKGESNRFYKLGDILSTPSQEKIMEYFTQKTYCSDKDLLNCIASGIAFHHAGLTVEEREEIEFLFRTGSLKILVSTSTLSSGVNLPAHRVIIFTSNNSYIPLTSITYRQMVGRAGRQGQHVVSGESYVLCSKSDWPNVQHQIGNKKISSFPRSTAKTILEAVNSEFVTTRKQLKELLSYLFLPAQDDLDVELERLSNLKLISFESAVTGDAFSAKTDLLLSSNKSQNEFFEEKKSYIVPTQLGRAVLASSLSPGVAMQIFVDLGNASKSLCVDSELHMLYLVTPINNLAVNVNAIDWNFYHQKWAELPEPLMRVARRVGVTEKFFMQKLGGKLYAKNDESLNIHVRFFATLILFELINENSLVKVSKKFRINRGLLQSIQQQAATYAYMIVAFCDRLGWFYLKTLLDGFAERLQFGVRRDLTELVRVPGIDAIRARQFHQNGIKSLIVLANASIDQICRVLRKAVPFPANPNAEQNKNTWLFGEPPLEDFRAAQIIIERACEVLSDKLELNFMPSLILNKKGIMDVTLNSLNSTSRWMSDDLTVSELMHESAMYNLCQTLSPLQLTDKSLINNKGGMWTSALANNNDVFGKVRRKSLNSILPSPLTKASISKVTNRLQHNNLLPSDSLNYSIQSSNEYDESNNVNNTTTSNSTKVIEGNLDSENESGDLQKNTSENLNRKPESSLNSSQNQSNNKMIQTVCCNDFSRNNKEKGNKAKTVKIELDSIDCAEIIVDGQPLKLHKKKKWADRVSKGATPAQSPYSPLNKKRLPLSDKSVTPVSAKAAEDLQHNNEELADKVLSEENSSVKEDSFDKFWEEHDKEQSNDVCEANKANDCEVIIIPDLNKKVTKNVSTCNNSSKKVIVEQTECEANSHVFSDLVDFGCQAIVQSSSQISPLEIEQNEQEEEESYFEKENDGNVKTVINAFHSTSITVRKNKLHDAIEKRDCLKDNKICEEKLKKCGIEFVCRCNWSNLNLCKLETAFTGVSFCGICLVNDCVLIFSLASVRCFLLPLHRMEGSCKKCKTIDFENLLVEILVDGSIKKWFPDALNSLRLLRHIFLDNDNKGDASFSGRKSGTKNNCSNSSVSKQMLQPCNIGCIRTLEALNCSNFVKDDDFGEKKANHLSTQTIRKLAKKYEITKWNPLPKSLSKSLSLPSITLSCSILGAAKDAFFAVSLASKLFTRSNKRQYALQCLYLESMEVIGLIELAGLEFNRLRCTKLISHIAVQMAAAEKQIFRLCGGEKFNLDSPDEVSKILFVKLNLSAPENASCTKRHFSTNTSVLKQLSHPVADAIIKWRKLQNSYSVLRSLLQEAAIQEKNGSRIRTCFDNLGGIAGRITTSSPNLQFLPKEQLVNNQYSARSTLVASPGMVFLAADYCQLELRVLAELSKDTSLIKLLKSFPISDDNTRQLSDDPFEKISDFFESHQNRGSKKVNSTNKENLRQVLENTTNNPSIKCDRQRTKQLCYAIIYGMGAETLGRELGIPKTDAQFLIKQFFELFPKVKSWIDERMIQYRERGYCETFMGKKREFPTSTISETIKEERRIGRQCINYIIQGTASEMFRQALVNVHQRFKREFNKKYDNRLALLPQIVMQIHDEIIVEVAEHDVQKCKKILQESMENVFLSLGFTLCYPVKLSRGKSWGSLQPF